MRATDTAGQISDWSEPLKFLITTQGAGVSAVPVSNLTSVYLGGNVYVIRGTSAPGTSVRVSGRDATAASDGTFQVQITPPSAPREVTIQASALQATNSQYRLPLP